jgi:HSP20 family molecular chaperone IbpA
MQKKQSFFERLTGSISLRPDKDDGREEKTKELTAAWEEGDEAEGELAVDVYQTPSEIVIKTMVSGVRPEDLQISITREMVSIRGKRGPSPEVEPEDYFQKELYWGSFSRIILLPAEIDVEEAEAIEKHGLLTIRLPKIDKAKTQTLKVKTL